MSRRSPGLRQGWQNKFGGFVLNVKEHKDEDKKRKRLHFTKGIGRELTNLR